MGMPAARAASTTAATRSGPPMLPGLIRTAATPASIAFSARLALKWMSAITGIGLSRTMRLSASASSDFGTAHRTTSQPAEARAAIWAVVASTSRVSVSVIDWTTTGAPPPSGTLPTRICLCEVIRVQRSRRPAAARPSVAEPADVVRQADEEEHQHQRDADCRETLVDIARHRTPAHPFEQGEEDVPAVEWQER